MVSCQLTVGCTCETWPRLGISPPTYDLLIVKTLFRCQPNWDYGEQHVELEIVVHVNHHAKELRAWPCGGRTTGISRTVPPRREPLRIAYLVLLWCSRPYRLSAITRPIGLKLQKEKDLGLWHNMLNLHKTMMALNTCLLQYAIW